MLEPGEEYGAGPDPTEDAAFGKAEPTAAALRLAPETSAGSTLGDGLLHVREEVPETGTSKEEDADVETLGANCLVAMGAVGMTWLEK